MGSLNKKEKSITEGSFWKDEASWWWWWNSTAYVKLIFACWPYGGLSLSPSLCLCMALSPSSSLSTYLKIILHEVEMTSGHTQPTHRLSCMFSSVWLCVGERHVCRDWLIEITSKFPASLQWKSCRRSPCKLIKFMLRDPDAILSLHGGTPRFWQSLLTANNPPMAAGLVTFFFFFQFQTSACDIQVSVV